MNYWRFKMLKDLFVPFNLPLFSFLFLKKNKMNCILSDTCLFYMQLYVIETSFWTYAKDKIKNSLVKLFAYLLISFQRALHLGSFPFSINLAFPEIDPLLVHSQHPTIPIHRALQIYFILRNDQVQGTWILKALMLLFLNHYP